MIYWKLEIDATGYEDDDSSYDDAIMTSKEAETGEMFYRTKKEATTDMRVHFLDVYFPPIEPAITHGSMKLVRCEIPCRYANSRDLVAALNGSGVSERVVSTWTIGYEPTEEEDEYHRRIRKSSGLPEMLEEFSRLTSVNSWCDLVERVQ